jgi:hypothetical protein
MRALEAEVASAGLHLTLDSSARFAYSRQIEKMSVDLSRRQVATGRLTWLQAAQQAQEARNIIMKIMRDRSTLVGRSIAEYLKLDGRTFNYMTAAKTIELFGEHANFERLTSIQKNRVYAAIVTSAGKSRMDVTSGMRLMGPTGRGLIIISLALSIYTVANAKDKIKAASHEAAITGAGIGGSIAGEVIAGLACGPAAPVCVTVGVFAGGALAAFGVDFFW